MRTEYPPAIHHNTFVWKLPLSRFSCVRVRCLRWEVMGRGWTAAASDKYFVFNRKTWHIVEASWNVIAHAQKPDFVFRRNGRVHLNQRGASVQSTTGSRGVRISGSNGSNAGNTMFWGTVQDYWLPTPLACFPFTSPTVRHRVPSHFNWTLPQSTSTTAALQGNHAGCSDQQHSSSRIICTSVFW